MSDLEGLPTELYQEILLLAAPPCLLTRANAAARLAGATVALSASEQRSLDRLRRWCSFSAWSRANLPTIERLWLKDPALNIVEFAEFCRTEHRDMSVTITICPDEIALHPPDQLYAYDSDLTPADLQAVPTEWFAGTVTRATSRFWWALTQWWTGALKTPPRWIRHLVITGTLLPNGQSGPGFMSPGDWIILLCIQLSHAANLKAAPEAVDLGPQATQIFYDLKEIYRRRPPRPNPTNST